MQFSMPPWVTDKINENLNSQYYGVAIGDQLDYQALPQLKLFTNITLQLLHVRSKLDTKQIPNVEADPNTIYYANDTQNKFTYRTKATFGLNYAFTQSSSSSTLRFAVGVDQWGYVPGVHNPKGYGDTQAAHIVGYSYWNPFANISLRVPF